MKTNGLWKMLAAAFIAALFYIGGALYELAGGKSLTPTAYGDGTVIGPALTIDAEDILITSSADGQKLYRCVGHIDPDQLMMVLKRVTSSPCSPRAGSPRRRCNSHLPDLI